jgi:putative oxidoreductase
MDTTTGMPRSAPVGAFILRVCLGLVYLGHSVVIKVMVLTLPGTVEWFESLGYPVFLVYVVLAIEVVAGLALVLGVYARWAALAVIPVAVGATCTHLNTASILRGERVGWEYPMLLVVLSLVQFLIGDGAFALRPRRTGDRAK